VETVLSTREKSLFEEAFGGLIRRGGFDEARPGGMKTRQVGDAHKVSPLAQIREAEKCEKKEGKYDQKFAQHIRRARHEMCQTSRARNHGRGAGRTGRKEYSFRILKTGFDTRRRGYITTG
jgi:hypothetical protein